jgi:hypothetical protein
MLDRKPLHDRSGQPAIQRRATLAPSPDSPRMYAVKDVGTLRVTGWTWSAATAEAGGRSWQITRRGVRPHVIQAADVAGDVVGEFSGRRPYHSAPIRWCNRELILRREGTSYDLVDGDGKIATIDGRGAGNRHLTITTDDTDPGLLLFAIYVALSLMRRRSSGGSLAARPG